MICRGRGGGVNIDLFLEIIIMIPKRQTTYVFHIFLFSTGFCISQKKKKKKERKKV
jgi:hypothetical protein